MSKTLPYPDEKITAFLQKGDQQAIANILDKYGDALYGVVYRMVASEAIAKDIMQDAFVKIWKNATTYDPSKGRLYTWLNRIVRNTAIDMIRTDKFKRNQTSKSIDESVTNTVRHSEEMKIQDVGLQKVINSLDPKYKEVIDLIYLQGYTQQETTDALGIPLGTVKSRVKIAIRELRKLLGEQELTIFLIISILGLLN